MTQKERKVPKSAKVVLVYVLAILLEFTIVNAYLAQSLTISTGVYPSAASYTVWVEGSTFFAKDAYGNIDFSGTNASALIEDCLEVFARGVYGASEANGGRLHFAEGNYTSLTGNFTIPDNTLIDGDGMRSKLAMGTNDLPLFFVRGYNIQIRNLNLQGTKSAGAKTYAHGIYVYSPAGETISGLWIENNILYGFNHTGIYIDGGGGSFQNAIFINNNNIYQNGADGIYIGDTCWESYIHGNSISYNGQHGIHVAGGGETIINENDVYVSHNAGIYIYAGTTFDISDNEIVDSGQSGILIDETTTARGIVDANRCFNNDVLNGGDAGITISNSNRTVVSNNICDSWATGSQDYGIKEVGTSDWNVIIGNACWGETTGVIYVGTNTIHEHNINQTAT